MNVGRCSITSEDAPPGFWLLPGADSAIVDGVEFESSAPTRLFQSLDSYPQEWGRLSWRVQLNKLEAGRAALPVFRTFYPGVEWNLRAGGWWFLSAWFKWEGSGPPYPQDDLRHAPRIEGDTAVFCVSWWPRRDGRPDATRAICLRSRVDARNRRTIAQSVASHSEHDEHHPDGVIVLDDLLEP